MADGSIIRAVFAKLLPQTLLWFVMAIFMEAWLFSANVLNGRSAVRIWRMK